MGCHRGQYSATLILLGLTTSRSGSIGGRGIRYHRADSQEDQDAVLAFGEHRRLLAARTTVLA
ncbi:MAG: hypothetical protein F9K30_19790 [Dechloromonas sp.]|nr:MAG: hypothetical protein F9K30_19790 [Dechloromonas sp.]